MSEPIKPGYVQRYGDLVKHFWAAIILGLMLWCVVLGAALYSFSGSFQIE